MEFGWATQTLTLKNHAFQTWVYFNKLQNYPSKVKQFSGDLVQYGRGVTSVSHGNRKLITLVSFDSALAKDDRTCPALPGIARNTHILRLRSFYHAVAILLLYSPYPYGTRFLFCLDVHIQNFPHIILSAPYFSRYQTLNSIFMFWNKSFRHTNFSINIWQITINETC